MNDIDDLQRKIAELESELENAYHRIGELEDAIDDIKRTVRRV